MNTQVASKTQFLARDGGKIAYDDNGSGSLVVCVPGLGELRQEFRFLTPLLLAAGFRVVTMDLRGHGDSSAKWSDVSVPAVGGDISALLRQLNAGPAIVVANSMACGAAVVANVAAPELFAGLALTGPVVRGEVPAWMARIMLPVMFARPWGIASWRMYYKSLYPTAKPADFDSYLAHLLANLGEPGRLAVVARMSATPKSAAEPKLGAVSVPVMLVMGSKDRDFKDPAGELDFIKGKLKTRTEVMLVEGAGHYPHVEMAAAVNPPIVAFCQQIVGAKNGA